MTTPILTPTNHRTKADAAAERYREYRHKPAGLWPRVRAVVLAGLAGLALGAGGMAYAGSRLEPLAGAVAVRNAVITIENDGTAAFLVNGWIVPLPKAAGQ